MFFQADPGTSWAGSIAACMEYPHNRPYTADDLVRIITLLRDPVNGCPWDKVQTHTSIRMNFLEEAYEAVDALDLDDPVLMCEELGDVLMQVAFHTCMEQETGRFTWEQVCDGVCQKLIERHPNIFGTQPGYEGITDWDALKNKEKGRRTLADDVADAGRVIVNGKPAKASYAVKIGDVIEITFGNRPVKVRVLSIDEPKGKDVARELFEILEG